MSRHVVIGTILIGVLVASPVMAQRQRNPGGGSGGGSPRATQGGRPAGPSQGGGRTDAGPRAQPSRPYGGPAATARTTDPYRQAYRQAVPRANVAPGTSRPAYAGRPGYVAPRSYAVPRGYGSPRPYGHGGYYGRPSYYGRPGYYYGPPRYIAPGWRGPWRHAVLAPRFIYPPIVSIGYWQPYYYRPSIGVGIYYGADGLYPFGAVPQAYYDPSPGVAYGGVRITDAPPDAQVFADGNYVGIVDDFDGLTQHLNLEDGRHRVEIHADGLTPIAFDVDVIAGQTITLQAEIR